MIGIPREWLEKEGSWRHGEDLLRRRADRQNMDGRKTQMEGTCGSSMLQWELTELNQVNEG